MISQKFMLQREKTNLYQVQDGFILLEVQCAKLQERAEVNFYF